MFTFITVLVIVLILATVFCGKSIVQKFIKKTSSDVVEVIGMGTLDKTRRGIDKMRKGAASLDFAALPRDAS